MRTLNRWSQAAIVLILINLFSPQAKSQNIFETWIDLPVASQPQSVCSADLDGDGDDDLVAAGRRISVVINEGNENFRDPANYGIETYYNEVLAIDLDGDGYKDLASTNWATGGSDEIWQVSVFINNGDGTFQSAVDYAATDYHGDIASADFDGDGDYDLATANGDGVTILLNNGSGVLDIVVKYPAEETSGIDVGDFDSDGDMDVMTIGYWHQYHRLLSNTGDGTFELAYYRYGVPGSPSDIFSDDLDGDGDLDMVVTLPYHNELTVLLNNGYGDFTYVSYPCGRYPQSVVSSDLDGDGDADLVATCSGAISVLLNDGSAVFTRAGDYAIAGSSRSVTTCDLNGDGYQDITAANSSQSNLDIYLGNGDGTFRGVRCYDFGFGPSGICSDDLDGDGDKDLVATNSSYDSVVVLANNGDGTFLRLSGNLAGDGPWSIAAADFDGDGDKDLATANRGSDPNWEGTVSVLLNDGGGSYGEHLDYPVGTRPMSMVCADYDGDGDNDLAVANEGLLNLPGDDGNVAILLNNGDGSFAGAIPYEVVSFPHTLLSGDMDGDGDDDLAVFCNIDFTILINNGDGTFFRRATYSYPYGLSEAPRVCAGDLDSDADLDLALYWEFAQLSLVLNNGDATFEFGNSSPGYTPCSDLTAVDLDGDGDIDLSLVDYSNSDILTLLNDGSGIFQTGNTYRVSNSPAVVISTDFNADGSEDLAVAGELVTVLLNDGIVAPRATLTSPSGGETWVPGQTVNITWNNAGTPADHIALYLLQQVGPSLETTLLGNFDYQSIDHFEWVVDAPFANLCWLKIQVSNADGSNIDYTEKFTIAPSTNNKVILIPGIMGTHIYQLSGSHLGWPCGSVEGDCECWYSVNSLDSYFDSLCFDYSGQNPVSDNFGLREPGAVFGEAPGDWDDLTPWTPLDRNDDKDYYSYMISSIDYQTEYARDINFFVFPYDWRYDNFVTADSLSAFIDRVSHPSEKIDIVAHSMGGIVARLYANYHPGKIDKTVFIATPHHGSLKMLIALLGMDSGVPLLSARKAREMALNYISCYQLLPDESVFGSYFQEYNTTYEYTDPSSYTTPAFGLEPEKELQDTVSLTIYDEAGVLEHPLINHANFENNLYNYRGILGNSLNSIDNPYIIAGYDFPTPLQLAREHMYELTVAPHTLIDIEDRIDSTADGDGTVTRISAATHLDGIVPEHIFYHAAMHGDLPNDESVRELTLRILLGLPTAGVNGIVYNEPVYQSRLSGYTCSPITVELTDGNGNRNYYNFEYETPVVEIPFSTFSRIGEHEYFSVPDTTEVTISVKGLDQGLFSLYLEHGTYDTVTSRAVLYNVRVDSGSTGLITAISPDSVPAMIYDENGDGVFEDSVSAQEIKQLGAIAGLVIQDSLPLTGFEVTLTDSTGAVLDTALTDSGGYYRFDELPLAQYSVIVDVPRGYACPYNPRKLIIQGITHTVNFVMYRCCGIYTGGYKGNTDCDVEGKRNLADITRLIDRVYLSKQKLCCEENGNADGDVDGKINLADITRLIDHIYLSKAETAMCD